MTIDQVLNELRSLGSLANVAGMARFGITSCDSFGVSTAELKKFARDLKKQVPDRHQFALKLWRTGNYDARAVAFLIDDPKKVTFEQMEEWAIDFDNWATVDGTCCYLFCRTSFAYDKVFEWAEREPEFIKRAAFSLIAYLTVHDKKPSDEKLAAFLPLIERHADDDRNYVKKAVNWALRQIGKRNLSLNQLSIETAERIKRQNTRSARWIAADALRELQSKTVHDRLASKK